jgi:hypothetical protein
MGGIGMFNLKEFLNAQKFVWVTRAIKLPIDNWRYDLHLFSPQHNIFMIRPGDVDKVRYPILFGLTTAFCLVRSVLEKKNIHGANIFENPNFLLPLRNYMLNAIFFTRESYLQNEASIRSLTLKECYNGNNVKSVNEFINIGIPLTVAKWLVFAGAIGRWKLLANELQSIFDRGFNLQTWILNLKKGSHKIRDLYAAINLSNVKIENQVSVITYGRLIDCPLPDPECIGNWLKLWAVNFLPNDLKSFMYNSRFNCLPLNNRLNAYRVEIDARCTFCMIADNTTTQKDGYRHFFCTVR